MAQLRHDDEKFAALNTQIIVIVPNGPLLIKRYLRKHQTPYSILTDHRSQVARQYGQEKQFFIVGKPAVFLVDQKGKIAYALYAENIIDKPDHGELLAVLAEMEG